MCIICAVLVFQFGKLESMEGELNKMIKSEIELIAKDSR